MCVGGGGAKEGGWGRRRGTSPRPAPQPPTTHPPTHPPSPPRSAAGDRPPCQPPRRQWTPRSPPAPSASPPSALHHGVGWVGGCVCVGGGGCVCELACVCVCCAGGRAGGRALLGGFWPSTARAHTRLRRRALVHLCLRAHPPTHHLHTSAHTQTHAPAPPRACAPLRCAPWRTAPAGARC